MVLKWPLGIQKTFSQHAAQSRCLSLYYFFIFIITMPIICLFIYFWLIPQHYATSWVFVSFLFVTLTQIICTFFPERGSARQVFIHRLFAGMSASFLFACVALLCLSLDNTAQVVNVVALCVMGLVAFIAFIAKGRFALILQTIYYLAFFIPILVLL